MTQLQTADQVKKELKKYIEPERAHVLSSFFKTGKGQYGEGDTFIGVTVPNNRIVSAQAESLPQVEILELLSSHIHEYRLCALCILVLQVGKLYKTPGLSTSLIKKKHKEIVDFYMNNVVYINNWDLVDVSAHYILGSYLFKYHPNPSKVLLTYAKSSDLWTKRISMISTFYGIQAYGKMQGGNDIKNTQKYNLTISDALEPAYTIAEKLLLDRHDLIQKAVGWMLREAGKRDEVRLRTFLNTHAKHMPRTALRYAIEKFNDADRAKYMNMKDIKKK